MDDVELFIKEIETNESEFLISIKPMLTAVGFRYAHVEIDGKLIGAPIPLDIKTSEITSSPPKLVGGNWSYPIMTSGVPYPFTIMTDPRMISDAGISFLDANGNLVDVAKHTIDWSEAEAGKVKFTVVPNVTGTWNMYPTINGEPTAGSPFAITVNNPPKEIAMLATPLKLGVANATAVGQNLGNVEGLSRGLIGTPATFVVTPHDLTLGPLDVTFKSSTTTVLFDTEVRTSHDSTNSFQIRKRNDGSYVVKYTPDVAGDYEMMVTMGGKKIKNAPFQINIPENKGCSKNSRLAGHEIFSQGVGVGASVNLDIAVKDMANKASTYSIPHIEIVNHPEIQIAVAPRAGVKGTYTVSFLAPPSSGSILINAYVEEKLIADCPWRLQVKPGQICSRKCYLEVDLPIKAVPLQPGVIKVHLRDEFGNVVRVANLKVRIAGRDDIKLHVTQGHHEDFTSIEYLFPLAGEFMLHVATETGDEISGSPFPITVGKLLSSVLRETDTSIPRLICIDGRGQKLSTTWTPLTSESLNLNDLFLLDNNSEIYQWSAKPGVFALNKAMALVRALDESRSTRITHKVRSILTQIETLR